jgi:hypothetical protein
MKTPFLRGGGMFGISHPKGFGQALKSEFILPSGTFFGPSTRNFANLILTEMRQKR